MNIFDSPKYLVNPNLSEISDQMGDINNFLDHVDSEAFERIRRSYNVIVFDIPRTRSKTIRSKPLTTRNMKYVQCACTRMKTSQPSLYLPILFRFPILSNTIIKKKIIRDVKNRSYRTPWEQKAGKALASMSQTFPDPKCHKIRSGSEKKLSF